MKKNGKFVEPAHETLRIALQHDKEDVVKKS